MLILPLFHIEGDMSASLLPTVASLGYGLKCGTADAADVAFLPLRKLLDNTTGCVCGSERYVGEVQHTRGFAFLHMIPLIWLRSCFGGCRGNGVLMLVE